MKSVTRTILGLLVLLLEFTGIALIWYGLRCIWAPISWIFAGAFVIYVGISLYRILKEQNK